MPQGAGKARKEAGELEFWAKWAIVVEYGVYFSCHRDGGSGGWGGLACHAGGAAAWHGHGRGAACF